MTQVVIPNEHLMKVLMAFHITEKTDLIGIHNQYVFKVRNDANKTDIKNAVESLFEVKVDGVQVSRVKSKVKRFGRIEGRRKGWKKAYVKLAAGYKIELTGA